MSMYRHLKIAHHSHSGRMRPHEHTSYFPLMILLIIVGVVLVRGTTFAVSPGPESSSIGLSGTVPEPPPTTGAIITSPNNQQRFDATPILVAGTCPPTTLVEVLKNNIFAGSTFCDANGGFSVEVDLLIGSNDLVARVYNSLNQPGPDSNTVTVFYDALPSQASSLSPLNFNNAQLVLSTNTVYRGIFPEQNLSMPIEIIGGTPPFALDVRWGDSENTMVPRDNNQAFNATHAYSKPGTYKINLQATDAEGRVAFLTVVAVVNGQPSVIADTDSGNSATSDSMSILNRLYVLWPIYVGALATVVSFWLGEQREKRILTGHGLGLGLKA